MRETTKTHLDSLFDPKQSFGLDTTFDAATDADGLLIHGQSNTDYRVDPAEAISDLTVLTDATIINPEFGFVSELDPTLDLTSIAEDDQSDTRLFDEVEMDAFDFIESPDMARGASEAPSNNGLVEIIFDGQNGPNEPTHSGGMAHTSGVDAGLWSGNLGLHDAGIGSGTLGADSDLAF